MLKMNIIIFLTILSCLAYANARQSIGTIEENQVLVWVQHKLTPVHPEKTNMTHVFDFQGADRNVQRITFITFDYETV